MPETLGPQIKTPVWQARTGTAAHPLLAHLSQSVDDDLPYLSDDLCGSIAHVAGLHAADLLDEQEATNLIHGLQELAEQHTQNEWTLDPALEDVHMNIEAAVQDRKGEVAGKLHTGRSRNDQVATAILLYARRRLFTLAEALHALCDALAIAAQEHLDTPWTARTHDQQAQPATIGFLLTSHALRAGRCTDHVLGVLDELKESPLGAGAVAGSTLPLRPETTAGLLGLEPLENALLATGTRDTVHIALGATTRAAPVLAGLATDLLKLLDQEQYTPPPGLTTGSSLMPHKRNPDALELARAHAHELPVHQDAVQRITLPLGLGYQRDLQLTKPHLVKALTTATDTTKLLALHLEPGAFTASPHTGSETIKTQAIRATDAMESLIAQGVPFRTAYRLLAEAAQETETHNAPLTTTLPPILEAEGIGKNACEQALHALTSDENHRRTRGGPAPEAVQATLKRLQISILLRQDRMNRTEKQIRGCLELLVADPREILRMTG